MNVNLDICIPQTGNQTVCVNEGMQIEHNANNGTLTFPKSNLCSPNLNKFSPITASDTKTVKINIDGNEVNVKIKGDTIDSSIFDGIDKSLVTSVVIPEGITTIEDGTFGEYPSHILENLVEVTLPSTLKIIGKNAFFCCESLKSIEIPKGIKTIDEFAFYGCTNLKSIKIPEGITNIEWGAFNGCWSLEDVTLPSTLKVIGRSAFSDCRSLKRIGIPKGVTVIEANVFFDCWALEEVTLPSELKSIGECAFYGCEGLERITLPKTIEKIGYEAFYGCENLRLVNATKDYDNLVNGANVTLYRSPLSNSVSAFYSNKSDLKKIEELCKSLFPDSKITNNYLNVEEQSQGVSSKLNWAWDF